MERHMWLYGKKVPDPTTKVSIRCHEHLMQEIFTVTWRIPRGIPQAWVPGARQVPERKGMWVWVEPSWLLESEVYSCSERMERVDESMRKWKEGSTYKRGPKEESEKQREVDKKFETKVKQKQKMSGNHLYLIQNAFCTSQLPKSPHLPFIHQL